MVHAPADAPMPYKNDGGYTRFLDQDQYPCQQPPWGELSAVNANTGDIAWRVPLGSYDELDAQGVKNAGSSNMSGSIATAGGLVFIAATTDSKFRAFDSSTGKELWVTRLDATGDAVPMTYQASNGKQYVMIAAGGTNRFRMIANTAGESADSLTAFALPDAGQQRAPTLVTRERKTRLNEKQLAASGPPLPDGDGKQVVVRMCTACHGTAVFSQIRMGRAGWEDEVADMVEKGATGSKQDIQAVVNYMVKFFGQSN
jgi:quinoprotein glucose dehydrogenase